MNQQAAEITANLTRDLAPWWGTVTLLAYLIGFFLVVMGLYKFAAASQGPGRSAAGSNGAVVLPVLFGSLMLALPQILNMLTYSVFNQPAPTSALRYAPPASTATGTEIRFAVMVIHMVGLYAVVKGLYLMSTLSEGRGGEFVSACWHLIGGAFALRIDLFMNAIGGSAGGVVQSVIGKLFPGA